MSMPLPPHLTREALDRNARDLAAIQPPDEVDLQDFSVDRRPIRFTADGETYDCWPVLPLDVIQKVARMARGDGLKFDAENVDEAVEKIVQVFELLMPPESAERFTARLRPGHALPLDIRRQVLPIMRWILERYGLRPTGPSGQSSLPSPDGTAGTSSTDGAQPTA